MSNVNNKKKIKNALSSKNINAKLNQNTDINKTQPININTSKTKITSILNSTAKITKIFVSKKDIDKIISDDIKLAASENSKLNVETKDINISAFINLDQEYSLVEKFAEGGQGNIYKAQDVNLKRTVAIKELKGEFQSDVDAQITFLKEAKITAQLDHPGIIPIYSINANNDKNLCIAMKYINGKPLNEYLETIIRKYRNGGISEYNEEQSLRYRLEIFMRTCAAMAYAHSKNIMHCDLKPENIMVGEFNDSFITDWGIAKLIHSDKNEPWSRPDKITGTPGYLSPEAIIGKETDHRADIFSLGAILFRLVFLKNAFGGYNTEMILSNIHSDNISSFKHRFKHKIDKDLIAIIKKALANNLQERYQKIDELSDDIRNYLRGESISAKYDMFWTKFIRWSKRHIVFLLTIMIIFMSATLFTFAHTIHEKNILAENRITMELSDIHNLHRVLNAVGDIRTFMNRLETSMYNLANYIVIIDEINNKNDNKSIINFSGLKRDEIKDEFLYSKVYNGKINIKHLKFVLNDKMVSEEDGKNLSHNYNMLLSHMFFSIVNIDKPHYQLNPKIVDIENIFIENGSKILSLNFMIYDKFFGQYPAMEEINNSYFEYAKNRFTTSKLDTNSLTFSPPTYNKKLETFVIYVTAPIINRDQKLIGYVGAILSLQAIQTDIKNNVNGKKIEDIFITHTNGEIVYRHNYNYDKLLHKAKNSESGVLVEFFNDKKALREMKINKFGLVHMGNDRKNKIIYAYAYLENLDLIYIEKLNLDNSNLFHLGKDSVENNNFFTTFFK